MNRQRLAGLILILSTVVFIIGVGQPVINDVFSTEDAARQLKYMEANPDEWDFGNLVMGIAGLIGAVGIGIFAWSFQTTNDDERLKQLSYASVIGFVIAAICWMSVCYNRVTLPPEDVAGDLNIHFWTMPLYLVGIVPSVVLTGYILMRRYSKWGGRLVMGFELVLLPVWFLPVIHFFPIALTGIVVLIANYREWASSPTIAVS
jgi:hypothetical protein